ncbi:MAG: glycosyltransferase [Gemmatimonadaceae bacterium]
MTRLDVLAVLLDKEFMLENAPVLQTQIGEQILAQVRAGIRVGLLTTYVDIDRFESTIGRTLRDAGVHIALIKHGRLTTNIVRMAVALRRLTKHVVVRRAYARGIWGPIIVRVSGRSIPFVYDVRGALADETRGSRSAGWKAAIFAALESWCVRKAERVTAVSRALADDVARRRGRSDVTVIPSSIRVGPLAADTTAAAAIRGALGVPPDAVLCVYSGGLDYYQQIPQMLELWQHLMSDQAIRFLLLTNDAPNTRHGDPFTRVRAIGDRLTHRSLARADVPAYLAASDVGFMLRESRFLNRAASPVKFAEYLAAGLAVAASPGIGDISDLITSHRIGALVNTADIREGLDNVRQLMELVRSDREGIRQRAHALACTRYDWDAHAPVFRGMYLEPGAA